jgi:endogenous inhibitor of DNA gyrase (YacG/DUF329 family)
MPEINLGNCPKCKNKIMGGATITLTEGNNSISTPCPICGTKVKTFIDGTQEIIEEEENG